VEISERGATIAIDVFWEGWRVGVARRVHPSG
jgi:hypothetical protein